MPTGPSVPCNRCGVFFAIEPGFGMATHIQEVKESGKGFEAVGWDAWLCSECAAAFVEFMAKDEVRQ